MFAAGPWLTAWRHRALRPEIGIILAALVLLGCAGAPTSITPPTTTIELPEGRHYIVEPDASALRVILAPAGAMAAMGHAHVIGGAIFEGDIVLADPWQNSAFKLSIPVEAMQVDQPGWRIAEGLDPKMSEQAIADTKHNMLAETQLNAQKFPLILLESLNITGPRWQPDITFQITLVGRQTQLTAPVALTWDDESLTANGYLKTSFTALGMQPFSALGGMLRVADEIRIRFIIKAYRKT